ncbi:MAG: PIN domain-containing protein [Acidimicrobiales bacterium]|nr:PIN domain-containing protein [Acidimicrobiales bacterium]
MIFVDTSFWVALHNRRDARHEQARTLLERHMSSPLVTSNHVRGETWTFLRRRAGHAAAVSFLDAVDSSPRVAVVYVSEQVEARALSWLRRRCEREYSFVDATSFELMRTRRIRDALAFDGDFSAAGYVELREPQ